MILNLEKENFKEEINSEIVLIDFYADWCGPCRMLAPNLEKISSEDSSIKVIKVNVDKHEDIAREYGIMSIPTIVLISNGTEKKRHTGVLNIDELKEFLKN